jgi:hypothetical protein
MVINTRVSFSVNYANWCVSSLKEQGGGKLALFLGGISSCDDSHFTLAIREECYIHEAVDRRTERKYKISETIGTHRRL